MTSVLLAFTLGDNPLFWTPIALRWATERTHHARPLPQTTTGPPTGVRVDDHHKRASCTPAAALSG
jgi:hypothetical protein